MPAPRFRLRVRWMLVLVTLSALGLAGWKVWDDGPRTHWLLLKLKYGGIRARRSALSELGGSVTDLEFHELLDAVAGTPKNPRLVAQEGHQLRRRAELTIPSLVHAASDPDPNCRDEAMKALGAMASFHASELQKRQALALLLAATRDSEDSTRTTAIGHLAQFADRDLVKVLDALRSGLSDPSPDVRWVAIKELGRVGSLHPESRFDVATILTGILASRRASLERIKAAQTLVLLGNDQRPHPRDSGPDVVPALVAALRDPELKVCREAARLLGRKTMDASRFLHRTSIDAPARPISAWDSRRDGIMPALEAALAHDDVWMRREAALALFAFGRRDAVVLGLIEEGALDPDRSHKSRFEGALEEVRKEWDEVTHLPTDGDEAP